MALALGCSPPVASMLKDTDGSEASTSGEDGVATDVADDDAPSPPSDETGTTGAADDGAATAGGGGGTGGASGAGTEGGDAPAGSCLPACESAADCCAPLALGCPGPAYPNNWSCDDGACTTTGCGSDADCDGLLGLGPEECHPVAGVPTCVTPCEGGGCAAGTQCVGEADDRTTFCAAPDEAPCEDDADCDGAGLCDAETGRCVCGSDDDCEPADMACAVPTR